jgi:hypothetical protein
MPIKVQFPDGSEREMPSYSLEVTSREIPPGPPAYVEKPLPDSEWEFTAVIGGWIAQPRRS